jgi:3-O-alpha-D-mannopyranosyl-alpha-D-mannopyranose xylosylphosphotransferase
MALVTASGPLGLSAFFPPKEAVFVNAPLTTGTIYPRYMPPPHLPLTPTWHEADFSLDSVMLITALPDESVNLREYTMKLLSRYLYLSGEYVRLPS